MGGNTQKVCGGAVRHRGAGAVRCSSIVAAVFGAAAPIGFIGIGMTFGMTVTAMAFAIGPVSGCHLNPAVTAAVWASGRMSTNDAIGYIISQLIGGIVGGAHPLHHHEGEEWRLRRRRQASARTAGRPTASSSAMLAEFVATLIFTLVILAVTGAKGGTPMAGLIIGLTLMVIHFAFIPVSGSSVNGARSLGPAIFVGGTALAQVWMYLRGADHRRRGGRLAGEVEDRSTSKHRLDRKAPVSLARGRGFLFGMRSRLSRRR